MEQLFQKLFSMTYLLTAKNDEKVTFDESYILYVTILTFFNLVFCRFLQIEQLSLKNCLSGTCTLRGKNDVQLTFYDLYIFHGSKIDVF